MHSDLLKPPEDAAAEARMLLPVTPRPQQPVRPARSVRMPPFHPRAHLVPSLIAAAILEHGVKLETVRAQASALIGCIEPLG